MKTTNAMQLKSIIKKMAGEMGVSSQLVLQNYMLERLLERISLSPYRNEIIIKGGMLISSLIGIDKRTTLDLDTTIKGLALTHETIRKAFEEICSIEISDDIEFKFLRTEDIREIDDYPGLRVFLKANYSPMSVPAVVDVTTGDKITPREIEYSYPLRFDEGYISVMAYPLETILAEKLETVLARGIANTRPRDYYDIYMLWRLRSAECSIATLKAALEATAEKRRSQQAVRNFDNIIETIVKDEQMNARWISYTERFSYTQGLEFEKTCDTVAEIMQLLNR
jgi:predicted nucleotidyltransferase component of viral defense system